MKGEVRFGAFGLLYCHCGGEESDQGRPAAVHFPALADTVCQSLEEEYGVKLLDRGQAPVELAAAGSLFLEEKLRIENTELNLRKKLKQLSNPQAKITIGIGYNRGTRWVPLS